MAPAREQFRMPDGSTFAIVRSSEETGGAEAEVEFTLVPGGSGPPTHHHPEQVEEWEVLEGVLEARIGGQRRELAAGERASIPAGTPHTFANRSSAPVRVRDRHRPALGFDGYIAELGRLVAAGKVTGGRDPRSAMHLAVLWRRHRRMQVASSPPLRTAIALLARVGGPLGYGPV